MPEHSHNEVRGFREVAIWKDGVTLSHSTLLPVSTAPLLPLTASLLEAKPSLAPQIVAAPASARPERILQFGEGGFLRGFVDWMIHILNTRGLYDGSIVVVQPLPQGLVPVLNAQDGLYTQILRGVQNGEMVEERQIIGSISRGIVPQTDFASYLACARNPELRFVVSNTTEAGIACSPDDRLEDEPPLSFPGKLTQFLLERFNWFHGQTDKGLVMLPCELIEYNGSNLKRCVLEIAQKWNLSRDFVDWIESSNVFCNTLVDRIVTGFPKDEAERLYSELGYDDRLLNTGEIFHSWVIEGPSSLAKELPFEEAGLSVTWTRDYKPYRDRKVRILNGAHTMTVLGAYLAGKDMVKECMDDLVIRRYIARGLSEEIIPTLELPKADLELFAAAVSERFSNPHVQHSLLSISLNSISKFTARVLPSLITYITRRNDTPKRLTFALAALIAFYRGNEIRDGALIGRRASGNEYRIQDSLTVLNFFKSIWSASPSDPLVITNAVLANTALWNEDLSAIPGLVEAVAKHLSTLLSDGASRAFAKLESD